MDLSDLSPAELAARNPSMKDLDDFLVLEIFGFLDLVSAYRWGYAGCEVISESHENGVNCLRLWVGRIASVLSSALLRCVIPPSLTPIDSSDVYEMEDCGVVTSAPRHLRNRENLWRKKEKIIETAIFLKRVTWVTTTPWSGKLWHGVIPENNDESLEKMMNKWIAGEAMTDALSFDAHKGGDILISFMLSFIKKAWIFSDYEGRGDVLTLRNILRAADHFNIRVSHSERIYGFQLLTERFKELTLLELATMVFSPTGREITKFENFETSDHSKQVVAAKKKLACHMERCTNELVRDDLWLDTNDSKTPAPEEVLGKACENDSEWEIFLAMGEAVLHPDRTDDEMDSIYDRLREDMESFSKSVSTFTVEDREHHFRLCPKKFREICLTICNFRGPHRPVCPSRSATNLLQRILEDFIFGLPLGPIDLCHANLADPVTCHFIVGKHGTRMFCLNEKVSDEDDSEYQMESSDEEMVDGC